MASFVSFTGDGSTKNYPINFPYLDTDHVVVTLDGVVTTAWSWLDSSTLAFTTAPASGVAVRIARHTPVDERLATFTNGEALLDEELNIAAGQALFVAEEATDASAAAVATAGEANARSQAAEATADQAAADAATAVSTANAATATATGAVTTANGAVTTANTALSTANTAQTSAAAAAASAQALADTVAIHTAADLPFDDSAVSLGAANVQRAIEVIAGASGISELKTDLVTNTSGVTGATATEALDALAARDDAIETALADGLATKADLSDARIVGAVQQAGGQNLTGGFTATSHDVGGIAAAATLTPDPLLGNIQAVTNNGAHTLVAPAAPCSMILEYSNGATSGALTTSGFGRVIGTFDAAAGVPHILFVTKTASRALLIIMKATG